MVVSDESFLQSKYNLKSRIFKDKTNLKFDFWVNRDEQVRKWKEVIENALEGHFNSLNFIVGDYGMGKTFSLLRIRNDFKKRDDVFQTYLSLVSETKYKGGLDFIFRLFKSIDFNQASTNKPSDLIAQALSKIPNELTFHTARNVLSQVLLGTSQSVDTSLFGDLPKHVVSSSDLGYRFLCGETLNSKEQKKLQISSKKIDDLDDAKKYLASWLIVMRGLGYKAILILVDEFEYLFSLVNSTEQQKYMALLRSLHDLSDETGIMQDEMANLIFFFATSNDGWKLFDVSEERSRGIKPGPLSALKRRLGDVTVLEPFDKEKTKELIEIRMKYDRVRKKFEDKPLIPYTEDFVDFIYELTNGNPHLVLTRCDHVMDAGLSERIETLDARFAESVLKARGFYYTKGENAS